MAAVLWQDATGSGYGTASTCMPGSLPGQRSTGHHWSGLRSASGLNCPRRRVQEAGSGGGVRRRSQELGGQEAVTFEDS